jgi:membrane fusion protein (multidrug efflux system)
MRQYALPALGTIAGIAILYVAAMWVFVWRFQVSTEDAYVQADIAAIVTKLPGYVADIKVTDNQRVKAGDILVVLDVSDIKPKSDQAVAAVASRKAAVSNIQAFAKRLKHFPAYVSQKPEGEGFAEIVKALVARS